MLNYPFKQYEVKIFINILADFIQLKMILITDIEIDILHVLPTYLYLLITRGAATGGMGGICPPLL